MAEPVSLAELKAHLRLGSGTGEDTYLSRLLTSARRALELAARRTCVGSTPTLTGDDLVLAGQAILLIAGYWYENRDAVGKMPPAIGWILDGLRQWDCGGDA